MNKVYVIQHPLKKGVPLDISDAARYGELQAPFFPAKYNAMLDASDAVEKLETGLTDYTANDYIIAIGDPILIGIALAIAARNADGHVNFLKWNRHLSSNGARSYTAGNYVPIHIEVDVQ